MGHEPVGDWAARVNLGDFKNRGFGPIGQVALLENHVHSHEVWNAWVLEKKCLALSAQCFFGNENCVFRYKFP